MSILKLALKMTLQFLKKTNALEYFNPYVIEWLLHYVEGSQATKNLPKSLINITKGHIACTLVNNHWAFDETSLTGYASHYPFKGNNDWYTHPTMGVVGGFRYKLVSFEDKFILECEDDWDFNPQFSGIIGLPDFCDWRILIKILQKVGIPVRREQVNDGYCIGISEAWLTQFNEKHCFKTVWQVELPNKLSCPIDSPVKKQWERSQRKKRRFK